jgi:ferredoxin
MSNVEEEMEIYRNLQKHLNKMPIGFPSVKSGADLRLLKHLFTPEEAKIATYLKFGWDRDLETLETIHERINTTIISQKKLEKILDAMASKGSIMSKRKNGKNLYGNAELAVGMFEFQVNKLTEGFVEDFQEYMDQGWWPEALKVKGAQLRTIPVEQSTEPEHNVSTYDDLLKLLDTTDGPYVAVNCVCRQMKDVMEDPCKVTSRRELCLGFGEPAQLYIDQGWGRSISKKEVLEILRKNEDDGLVLQPDDSQHLNFICSCCGCCCEFLSKLKKLASPGNFTITNYYAEVDSELCTGCGTCEDTCQMNAISLKNELSSIKRRKCIGCGNCVAKCPSDAIHLNKKEREFTPYPSMDDLFDRIRHRKHKLQETASRKA